MATRTCERCQTEFTDDTEEGDGHEEEFPNVNWNLCGYCVTEEDLIAGDKE